MSSNRKPTPHHGYLEYATLILGMDSLHTLPGCSRRTSRLPRKHIIYTTLRGPLEHIPVSSAISLALHDAKSSFLFLITNEVVQPLQACRREAYSSLCIVFKQYPMFIAPDLLRTFPLHSFDLLTMIIPDGRASRLAKLIVQYFLAPSLSVCQRGSPKGLSCCSHSHYLCYSKST